jgi:hypothetical protein
LRRITAAAPSTSARFPSVPAVTRKLRAAEAAKNANARTGQLNAFENQLSAQTGKAITAAQAQILLSLERALR